MHRVLLSESTAKAEGFISRKAKRRLEAKLEKLSRTHATHYERSIAVFAHDHIGTRINLYGIYERRELDLLMEFLSPVMPNLLQGVCVDVGANIGNHTLYFSKRFSEVYAFEPNPDTFELLKFNTRGIHTVHAMNVGLGRDESQATLKLVRGNLGASSLVNHERGDEVSVRLTSLDAEMKGRDVSLIKIDTEGFEKEVLLGATAVIETCQPIVVFEQHRQEFAAGTTPAIDLLKSHGYRLLWIDWESQAAKGPVKKIWMKVREALFGRALQVSCGAEIPMKSHNMLIAIPKAHHDVLGAKDCASTGT
jgi:FkbM family methyltransferase